MTKREGLKIGVRYEVKVIDTKTGKVLKVVKGEGKTFNQNFSRLLGIVMFSKGDGRVSVSLTDIDGTARTMWAPDYGESPCSYDPTVDLRFRVGLGKSDVAFSRTQYNLLDPQAWVDYSVWDLVDDGTKVTLDVTGSWYNDTGVDVVIKEIGMCLAWQDKFGTEYRIMIARDVITATVVPAGSTIAVAYAITIPF